MKKQKRNSVVEYQYLKHNRPMPEGWQLANTLEGTPHGHYAVLIKRNGKEEKKIKD